MFDDASASEFSAEPSGPGVGAGRALVEGACALVALDLAELSDAELIDLLDDVERAQRRVDAVRCSAAAQVDVRGVATAWFGHITSAFLAARYGWSRGRAGSCVRIGRRLMQLDEVRGALEDGRINLEHAGLICRAANPRMDEVVSGCQGQLVGLAHGVRFERFARDVRALLEHADADGGHDPRPTSRSRLRVREGLEGELLIDGLMLGADALLVREVLDRWSNAAWRRHRDDAESSGDAPNISASELCAEAFVELLRRGHTDAAGSGKGPVVDVTLVVHADGSAPTDGSGAPVPEWVVDQLTCDPVIHPLLVGAEGTPLWLGHGVRFANRDQRRAANARDGGCVFPGCDAPPAWVDLHHVVRVADGGSTDLPNLASLCRRHHGVVHSRRWQMSATDDQWFEFRAPNGARLASQRHGRVRAGPSLE